MVRSKVPPRAAHGVDAAAVDALTSLVSELTSQLSTTKTSAGERLTRLQAAVAENQELVAAAFAENQTRPSVEEVRVHWEPLAGQEEEIAALKTQLAERRSSPPPPEPTLEGGGTLSAIQTGEEEAAGRDVGDTAGEAAGKMPRHDQSVEKVISGLKHTLKTRKILISHNALIEWFL